MWVFLVFTWILILPGLWAWGMSGWGWPPCDGVTKLITVGGHNWAELELHRNTVRHQQQWDFRKSTFDYWIENNISILTLFCVFSLIKIWRVTLCVIVTCVLSVYLRCLPWCDIVTEWGSTGAGPETGWEQGTRVMGTCEDNPDPRHPESQARVLRTVYFRNCN